ncbi:KLH11-like protein [Mya arenaria]|uniref:KLH11-like protein n=1 Tax=Mya arenaria TaxID=6604 RepID=A0ABY7FNB0_MYAAR|nr:KLH11-like protein [Mya arenaria]
MEMDEPYPRTMGNASSHALKLKQHLYDQMTAQSEFCDVTLAFCGIFSAVRAAITFLYTGTITLQYCSIKEILEVADYLQIDDLKSECTNYLMNVEITINNCVNLCLMASLYDLDIYIRVYEYIRGHLPEVLEHSDTLSLTSESIIEMLKDPTLSYVSKKEFFEFVLRWIDHDKENREQYFEAMFCEMDLKKMRREFLETVVESCELVKSSDKCKVHLLNVKMKHMAGLLPADGKSDVLLLVGGCGLGPLFHAFYAVPFLPMADVQTLNNIWGYVVEENRYVELAPLPTTMRLPVVAFHEATCSLYAFDATMTGIPVEDKTASVQKYDIAGKAWSTINIKLPSPVDDIVIHAIVILNEGQYMVASARPYSSDPNKTTQHNVYMFRISSDMTHCSTIELLCARNIRTEIQVCVAEDRYICVMCYKCGPSGIKRNKTVRFFVKDITKGPLKVPEFSKGAVHEPIMFSVKNEVYVTKSGAHRFRKFDLHTRKWTAGKEKIISVNTEEPRTDFSCGTYKNRLFMFGGKSGKTPINKATSIDFPTKAVQELEPLPRPIANCSVIPAKIPNELISCHIDCPHCKYKTMRSQVSYSSVIYPPDDDDYDEDVSYDEDDMYSDFWDNDVYDYDDMDIYPGPDHDWLF